ncbi:putative HNH endonuclease [Erwinia phage vB_EamP_Rexella]|uniref:Putative HNH endonuclease n=1 Tax=Erwinia phage vB_EamP_Rexella TaxID=1852642 RepID=A0A191ZD23_9CAUD|nr:putative HNH endonuclease [Erwinia phage vB_EamP_Rexella]
MLIPVVEIWKPIPGYAGYEASSLGNVRSFRSANGRGGLKTIPTLLKPTLIKDKPYYQLTLALGNGSYQQVRLHIVILETFKGPRPSALHEGCHNDGDPSNNAESNLRWGTKEDNTEDRLKHGTQVRGEKSPNTKLTDADTVNILRALANGVSGIELARIYQVGTTTISRIKNRQTWKHL